jgi:hypothetical protein
MRLKLPIGIQDFPTLTKDGYLYVDKTEHAYQLITGGKVYFLARPRRFGKSLFLSMLESIFKGQKNYFTNTWITQSDYDWPIHPVVRIDMSETSTRESPEQFKQALIRIIDNAAKHYDVTLPDHTISIGVHLSALIQALSAKYNRVVVLVDEYDKPMLDNIDRPEMAQTMRDLLRQFYTVLKSQDANLRFVMLTGVSKFSKVSVFSGLNNLQDISMMDKYATICGYTQQELESNFQPWIEALALKNNNPLSNEFVKIREWYNGYQFSSHGQRVYNSFSTLLLLEQQHYRPYWFATGTPTFLINLIERSSFTAEEIALLQVNDASLESHDITQMGLTALLYQTGYLTIKKYDTLTDSYQLDYPNFEVRRSFTSCLLTSMAEVPEAAQNTAVSEILHAILAHDNDKMFSILQSFFASIPYQLHQPTEKYYHSLFYLTFHLIGYRLNAEVSTHRGRLDATLELQDRILIFEFKLNQSADVALQQIHDKQYYLPYQHRGKPIVLFGVSFDIAQRNIVEWKSEAVT